MTLARCRVEKPATQFRTGLRGIYSALQRLPSKNLWKTGILYYTSTQHLRGLCHQLILAFRPCCLTWACPDLGSLPEHLPGAVTVKGYNATALKIKFRQLPKLLDGRSGLYQVHYVSGLTGHQVRDTHNFFMRHQIHFSSLLLLLQDPSQWPYKTIKPSQGKQNSGVFDIEDNLESSVVLTGLLPKQQYFVRTLIKIRDNAADTGYRVTIRIIIFH